MARVAGREASSTQEHNPLHDPLRDPPGRTPWRSPHRRPTRVLRDILPPERKPEFRRAAIAAVLAIVAFVAARRLGAPHPHGVSASWAAWGCGGAFVICAVAATRFGADELGRAAQARARLSASGPVRVCTLLAGYGAITLMLLDLFNVPLEHLAYGGAITGVVLGIAAQQSLGNLFAGLVLLFTRPYVAGERIVVRSGAVNGPLTGTVVGVGLLYTTLAMEDGPTNIPNSALVAAAVGPAPVEDGEPSQK